MTPKQRKKEGEQRQAILSSIGPNETDESDISKKDNEPATTETTATATTTTTSSTSSSPPPDNKDKDDKDDNNHHDNQDNKAYEFVDFQRPPRPTVLPPSKWKLWVIVLVHVYFAIWVTELVPYDDFLQFGGYLSPDGSQFVGLAVIVCVLNYAALDLFIRVGTFPWDFCGDGGDGDGGGDNGDGGGDNGGGGDGKKKNPIKKKQYGVGPWLRADRLQWVHQTRYADWFVVECLKGVIGILEDGFGMFNATSKTCTTNMVMPPPRSTTAIPPGRRRKQSSSRTTTKTTTTKTTTTKTTTTMPLAVGNYIPTSPWSTSPWSALKRDNSSLTNPVEPSSVAASPVKTATPHEHVHQQVHHQHRDKNGKVDDSDYDNGDGDEEETTHYGDGIISSNDSRHNDDDDDDRGFGDNNDDEVEYFQCPSDTCQTVLKIEHRINPTKLKEYHQWNKRIRRAVDNFPGIVSIRTSDVVPLVANDDDNDDNDDNDDQHHDGINDQDDHEMDQDDNNEEEEHMHMATTTTTNGTEQDLEAGTKKSGDMSTHFTGKSRHSTDSTAPATTTTTAATRKSRVGAHLHTIYMTFDNIDSLNAWMFSPRRKALMKQLEPMLQVPDRELVLAKRVLPDAFTDLLAQQGASTPTLPPKKWKVWWMTTLSLLISVRWVASFIPYYLEFWGLDDGHPRLSSFVRVFITTFLNAYVTTPFLLFLFAPWMVRRRNEVDDRVEWKTLNDGIKSTWLKALLTFAFYGGCVIAWAVKSTTS